MPRKAVSRHATVAANRKRFSIDASYSTSTGHHWRLIIGHIIIDEPVKTLPMSNDHLMNSFISGSATDRNAHPTILEIPRLKKLASATDPLWYKDAIIYELHVRAFADSNNDGIGDFPGLLSRLDYLQELGVTHLAAALLSLASAGRWLRHRQLRR